MLEEKISVFHNQQNPVNDKIKTELEQIKSEIKSKMGEEALQSKQFVTHDELSQMIANLKKDQETLASKLTFNESSDTYTNDN